MLIKSLFNDFYDHYAYTYGVDDKVVFVRNGHDGLNNHQSSRSIETEFKKIDSDGWFDDVKAAFVGKGNYLSYNSWVEGINRALSFGCNHSKEVRFDYYGLLVVVDTAYVVIRQKKDTTVSYRVLNSDLYNEIIREQIDLKSYINKRLFQLAGGDLGVKRDSKNIDYYTVKQSSVFLKLSEKINEPIYIIFSDLTKKRDGKITYTTEVPPLRSLNVNINPEELYISIYNFLINNKKDPDPALVDDVLKVEMKGFDKKISFRHRN